ncbi:MAG: aminoacyl-tRNA hydrolase [Acidobacteria bacterium]|nr:aminoacyl-tRNA hydrolase [Acidobacteriota bacterium]
MELVVGLGNPGDAYAATRHNVGFRVVDAVAQLLRAGEWRRELKSELSATGRGRRVWLAKPRTYMNCSGEAVAELLSGLEVSPAQCLVVVDDVDLPLGRLRLRRSGGPGTHNGLRDIVDQVGTGFPRLRLGVRGSAPWADLAEYVLAPFESGELEVAEGMIKLAGDAVSYSVFEGLQRAMNRFNQAPNSGEPLD